MMQALIVDDSRAMRRLIAQYLQGFGFETFEAANGREGLEQLRQIGRPDVVLVDWNMPEMNGLEFARAVRQLPAFFDLPLLMVTTESEMQRMAEAFMSGINEYVMKPFDRATIHDKLQLLGVA